MGQQQSRYAEAHLNPNMLLPVHKICVNNCVWTNADAHHLRHGGSVFNLCIYHAWINEHAKSKREYTNLIQAMIYHRMYRDLKKLMNYVTDTAKEHFAISLVTRDVMLQYCLPISYFQPPADEHTEIIISKLRDLIAKGADPHQLIAMKYAKNPHVMAWIISLTGKQFMSLVTEDAMEIITQDPHLYSLILGLNSSNSQDNITSVIVNFPRFITTCDNYLLRMMAFKHARGLRAFDATDNLLERLNAMLSHEQTINYIVLSGAFMDCNCCAYKVYEQHPSRPKVITYLYEYSSYLEASNFVYIIRNDRANYVNEFIDKCPEHKAIYARHVFIVAKHLKLPNILEHYKTSHHDMCRAVYERYNHLRDVSEMAHAMCEQ